MSYDIKRIRQDFPTLNVKVNGKPLVYLDNAATTLKPTSVIKAVDAYYGEYTSNVHRGVHTLSEKATTAFESVRQIVQKFINAPQSSEIIFTSGTTDAINLVAQTYGRAFCKKGDEIIVSEMEHHSNIVPWQMLCEEKGCILKVIPFNDRGELIIDELDKLISPKTKLISIVHFSNSLGTINPIEEIIKRAHKANVPVLIDAAQSVSHLPIDVQKLDCDFLVFSGHKLFGPTGTGVLYGKAKWLDMMPPYRGGGDMIKTVSFEKTVYNTIPNKFEAGTPHIAGIIGLGEAIRYVQAIGLKEIGLYKKELLAYATTVLEKIDGLKIIGTAKDKASVVSFVMDKIHAHDLGTLVDQEGVAVRTGHHCTMPVMKHFGLTATSRASLSIYNTKEEIDHLALAIKKAQSIVN